MLACGAFFIRGMWLLGATRRACESAEQADIEEPVGGATLQLSTGSGTCSQTIDVSAAAMLSNEKLGRLRASEAAGRKTVRFLCPAPAGLSFASGELRFPAVVASACRTRMTDRSRSTLKVRYAGIPDRHEIREGCSATDWPRGSAARALSLGLIFLHCMFREGPLLPSGSDPMLPPIASSNMKIATMALRRSKRTCRDQITISRKAQSTVHTYFVFIVFAKPPQLRMGCLVGPFCWTARGGLERSMRLMIKYADSGGYGVGGELRTAQGS
jgi:hypothetical protein